jgi:hypothetical protein
MAEWPLETENTSERRVSVRYLGEPGATSLLSESWPGFSRLGAKVRDIAHNGIALLVEEPLSPGTRLLVDMPKTADYPSSVVLAHLVHTTNLPSGEWLLTCNFVDELSDQDLKSFGAPIRPSHNEERRSGVRYPCSTYARYRLTPVASAQGWDGEVVNIAVHGLGLSVNQRLQIGTMLWLEIGNPGEVAVLTVRACVARISLMPNPNNDPFASRCLLGCRFLRELNPQELHACRSLPPFLSN